MKVSYDGVEMMSFFCPGCNGLHSISISGKSGRAWNGDINKPTITPAVRVRTGHHVPGYPDKQCWCTVLGNDKALPASSRCLSCHFVVTDGYIQFLGDCVHKLAGQTVPLADFPGHCE